MFYVPDCKQRLLSPQDYASFHGFPRTTDYDTYSGNGAFFHIKLQDNLGTFTCNIDYDSNIPIARMGPVPKITSTQVHCMQQDNIQSDAAGNGECTNSHFDATAALDILDEDNDNLSPPQKTLMLDHQRLGHLDMKHLQTLYTDHNITCEFDGCLTDGGYLLVIVPSPVVHLHSVSPAVKPKQRSDQLSPRLSRTSTPSNTVSPVANSSRASASHWTSTKVLSMDVAPRLLEKRKTSTVVAPSSMTMQPES
jgi:hypothetical protein